MPIFLCYDPYKRSTPWTQEKYQSMTSEFAKRRIKYFSISSPDELCVHLDEYKDEVSSIVFFPGSEKQRKYLFERYKDFNIHRIIFAHNDVSIAESNFSYIMSDFYGDMELAISHLREKGCKSIALFNANPDSYHDRMRIDTYKKFICDDPLIFTTNDKVYPSLTELLKCDEKIDAIICINDFVAFCLMLLLDRIDKEWQKKIMLLSFSNTILSSLCSPSLSSLSFNYIDGGKEVATIHRAIEKNPRMAYMRIVMKSSLSARETTSLSSPSGMVFSEYGTFSYDELKEIVLPQAKCMRLEKFLASCDDTDLKILHCLILSDSMSKISEKLYLSRDTIKYRLKKYKETLGIDTTAEFAALLKIWISPEKLEEFIISIKK